jgi:hypothetical protein
MKKGCHRKKIVLGLFLLVVAIIWFVAANRFENYVKNGILPKISKDQELVKFDPDSIKIHKYKFSVQTGEVEILANSDFGSIKAGQLKICYNPFTGVATAYISDDILQIKETDLGVYSEKMLEYISFNKELLDGDFSKMKIKIKINPKVTLKDILNHEVLFSAEDGTFTISGAYNPAIPTNYKLSFEEEYKKVKYFNSDYYKKLSPRISKFVEDIAGLDIDTSIDYFIHESEVIGALDTRGKYSLEFNKDYVKSIFLKGNKNPLFDLGSVFDIINNFYSVSINVVSSNSSVDKKILLSMSNNGNKKISLDFDVFNTLNLTDEQKQKLKPIFKEFLSNSITYHNSDFNLIEEDFEGLANISLNIEKFRFKLAGSYDKTLGAVDHHLIIDVNNHNIDFSGKANIDETTYSGNIKMSAPDMLINSVVNFIEKGLYPIANKMVVENQYRNSLQQIKDIVDNIKQNAFPVLELFSTNGKLNKGETLNANLEFDLQNNKFQINNKPLQEISLDERVVTFLKGLYPSEKQLPIDSSSDVE